jgi:RNA polymerase sigma-70 factor (ECF subfamily)
MPFHSTTDGFTFFARPKVALSAQGLIGSVLRVADRKTRESRLRRVVDDNIDFVARILRTAGTAEADIDDDVQRVFIVLCNRLGDVQIGSEKSFLLRTALHIAARSRRTTTRRREVLTDRVPEIVDPFASPEELASRRQVRKTVDQILSRMDEDLRIVFLLYEVEQMTAAEIGTLLEIPNGTVASRLRRARADFRDRVSMLENGLKSEVG